MPHTDAGAWALEDLSEACSVAALNITTFFDLVDAEIDGWVDTQATAEQRALYMSLIACGTPRFDAVCEAIELSA